MDSTSIVFTGDIGFDKYMENRYKDKAFISESVKAFLGSGNHLCVNVEGPLSDSDKNAADSHVSGLLHSMSPEVGAFLDSINADIWNICNNHIMDAGVYGIKDTLDIAEKFGVHTLGAGMNLKEAAKPLIINEAGGIGLIGVGYQRACRRAGEDTPGCFSWSDLELIKSAIEDIKSKCRWCIVVAHAGEEFTSLPSPYTRERYLEYLNMGADAVMAHHPHVPMNYERVGDKLIFYSLGNFVFDTDYQRSQYYTDLGVLVRLSFSNERMDFTPFGIRINRERETIEEAELPLIFTDVNEKEYKLLSPLSVKAFIAATKRQLRFLYPDKYKDATDEVFMQNFMEPKRSGRVEGETLDMQILLPIAEKENLKQWKESSLDNVKKYILDSMREKQ